MLLFVLLEYFSHILKSGLSNPHILMTRPSLPCHQVLSSPTAWVVFQNGFDFPFFITFDVIQRWPRVVWTMFLSDMIGLQKAGMEDWVELP